MTHVSLQSSAKVLLIDVCGFFSSHNFKFVSLGTLLSTNNN